MGWPKGKKHSEDSIRKRSESLKRKHKDPLSGYNSKSYKEKVSKALTNRTLSLEHIKNVKESLKNKKLSEEHKRNISKSGKGKKKPNGFGNKVSIRIKELWKDPDSVYNSSSFRGKLSENLKRMHKDCEKFRKSLHDRTVYLKHTKETKDKISKGLKGAWSNKDSSFNSKEYRKKLCIVNSKKWLDEDYARKVALGLKLQPNKYEKQLQKVLDDLFLEEYRYVGDFKLCVGGKYPDFVNIDDTKLIELYGEYWHLGDDGVKRINHFKKYGYDTLIIWASELGNEESLKSKIKQFHFGQM